MNAVLPTSQTTPSPRLLTEIERRLGEIKQMLELGDAGIPDALPAFMVSPNLSPYALVVLKDVADRRAKQLSKYSTYQDDQKTVESWISLLEVFGAQLVSLAAAEGKGHSPTAIRERFCELLTDIAAISVAAKESQIRQRDAEIEANPIDPAIRLKAVAEYPYSGRD